MAWGSGWGSSPWGGALLADAPPFLSGRIPAPGAFNVAGSTLIRLLVNDDVSIDLPSLNVQVRQGPGAPAVPAVVNGVIVSPFNGGGESLTSLSGDQIYEVILDPVGDLISNVTITIYVQVLDDAGNLLDTSYVFTTGAGAPRRPIIEGYSMSLDMYPFLLRSIREEDHRTGKLFLRRLIGDPSSSPTPQGFNAVWDRIVGRMREIPNLWSIEKIEDEHLAYLKTIVGWTNQRRFRQITNAIDNTELRRLIAASGALWNERGPEDTIVNVLSLMLATRLRIWNWFDFRWVLGETELGEEHEGTDPWLIDLPISAGGTAADEYRSNVRIVDNGSIDRDLARRVLNLMRPSGERFEITWIDFLDLFETPDDDVQWSRLSSDTYVVEQHMLRMLTPAAPELVFAIVPNATTWTQYVAAARVRGSATASNAVFGTIFYMADTLNYYAVLIDVVDQQLILRRVLAGTPTDLVTISLGSIGFNMLANVFYVLRVSVVQEGVTNRIVVSVDGSQILSTTDPTFTAGTVGLYHSANAQIECDDFEVFLVPATVEELGVNANP